MVSLSHYCVANWNFKNFIGAFQTQDTFVSEDIDAEQIAGELSGINSRGYVGGNFYHAFRAKRDSCGAAAPERNQTETSPAACIIRGRGQKKVFCSFYLSAEAIALPKPTAKRRSAQAGKKKFCARKKAEKTFLLAHER